MKRKFIFLAMLLLTLVGGVKWNVLNAQETVIVGNGESENLRFPFYTFYTNNYSQQIYTAQDLENHASGNITSIAIQLSRAQDVSWPINRNLTIYMLNTDKETFESASDWVSINAETDKFFSGVVTFAGEANNWITIELDSKFSYIEGKNILLCIQDNTGSGASNLYFRTNSSSNNGLQAGKDNINFTPSNISSYTGNIRNCTNYIQFTFEINDGKIPDVPANLEAEPIDHKSVSLTWNQANNALSYIVNVYNGETLVKTVNAKTNSCVVDGLDAETTYTFTVTSVRGSNNSEASEPATATTLVAPASRTIVFTLSDTYGDGWNNGAYLQVDATDGTSEKLDMSGGSLKTYELTILVGADVYVTYMKMSNSWPEENSYCINYKDDQTYIHCSEKMNNTAARSYSFTVESTEPSVVVSENTIALGTVRMSNHWSEKATVSETFNITAKYTTITEVSCDNTFFDVEYDGTTGIVTVGYDKTANVTGEQTGIITIKADGVEDVTVEVSATAYAPVTPDVIELVQEVEFTAGAYENIPAFATLHDDYNLPKEVNAGSTPDAVYHFTMEEDGVLTVNVTGTNAIAAVYKAEDMEGSGPMANNDYRGIVAGPTAPTTFSYDFNDGDLEDFTLIDADGDGNGWYSGNINYISTKCILSDTKSSMNDRIITKNKYLITNSSEIQFTLSSYYQEIVGVEISENGVDYETVLEKVYGSMYSGTENIKISLGDWEGKEVFIAIYHKKYDGSSGYKVAIDDLQLTDGSAKSRSLARSTEPQINAVQYPAGEYYLVAAAENAFTVTIETGSLPAPSEFAYIAPENGAKEQNNPILTWEAAQYATEYNVYIGTESTLTEDDLKATVETTSFQTEGLSNNTQYFWKVDAVNAVGTTKGIVYSFVTPLNQATELAVTDAELYPGETTTLTWTAAESALYYNIYVNEELAAESEETSFELTNLPHNVNPGNAITVTAVHTLGESVQSEAIYVKMAGEFNLVVNVKDAEGNAIENAAVAFITESNDYAYYDEYFQLVPAIETLYTDAEGKVTQTLAMPCVYGSPNWTYSYLEVVISKEYATSQSFGITSYTGGLSAGQDYVQDITLEYVAPQNPQADKYYYVEGEDMVLTWNEVEGAVGYNVYKVGYSYEIEDNVYTLVNEEAITGTTFTVENLKYDLESVYVTYAVTADYGSVESPKAIVYAGVTGKGQIAVTVTDGTNPIKGATVTLVGPDGFDRTQTYTFVTNEEGKFTGDMLIGSYYTATVSHYDYNEKVIENDVAIEYQTELSLDIVLEAKPSVEDITVIATDNGDYANVTWTGSYEKYNVYRRNIDTPQKVELLGEVAASPYTDNEWAELEYGTYQYGVSTFVEEQAQSRGGEEVIFEEDFEKYSIYSAPTTLKTNGVGYVYSEFKHGGEKAYWTYYQKSGTYDIVMSEPVPTAGVTLSFYHFSWEYVGTFDQLVVYWTTSPEGTYDANNVLYTSSASSWEKAEISLNDIKESSIYIVFRMNSVYANGIWLDDITITREAPSAVESQIVWSDKIVKRGALTFNNAAGDNDWSNEANWAGGVLPTAEDNVIVASEANINGVVAVNNLTINNARLTVKSGTLTVNGTITDSNQYGSLYFEDGAQIFQNNKGVNAYFRMNVKNPTAWDESNINGWQFISSPLSGADIASAATKYDNAYQPSDYDLYKYNGAAELEWVNHKSGNFESTFEQGRGYMYSHQARTIVTLGGTLNPERTFKYEVSYTEGEGNELANLHLLGNPFTFNMDWQYVNVSNVYNGYATLNEAGDDYVYATEGTINVGDGFFVQVTGSDPTISYEKTRGSKETAANINVIARGIAGEDNVIINFAGEGDGFSKLQGFNKDKATVFVANNGKRYGIANVDENTTEVALNFDAKEMGNYTISLDVNGEFETVTLVDRFTGIETNMLLEDEYNFTATSNDSHNRFVVRLANGQEPTANSQFVYQSGEELILSIEGSVQIVDMLGRVVYYNEHANGDNRINVAEFNDAAYVVRVVNEEGVKTQKVVIY